jgi:hypothetical protein
MRKETEPLNAGRFRPVIFGRGTTLLSAELPDGYAPKTGFAFLTGLLPLFCMGLSVVDWSRTDMDGKRVTK